jgi:predicted dehydrogenase
MMKVAIVGCGKIADQHAEQIVHIPGCEIVGVCDCEELMARQLQERMNLPACFTDVRDLVNQARPDVVHITTPPQTHYAIGRFCLESGCHIYMEKPFTINSEEAEQLIRLAQRKNLKLTVGHNAQFSHAANRMRKLVGEGYLGGSPLHLESYYCYDLGDAGYAKALLGDSYHWVRNLPGGLLQNTISHGISKIAEFLREDAPEVIAYGFTSSLLKSIGETSIVDELRVIVRDGAATAYFTFSTQMRPPLHMLRLYGPKNGLIVDENQQTVIKVRGLRYKSYLEQFLPPWGYAKQWVGNALGNMKRFARADFQTEYGMRFLIRAFYRSITENGPVPIPYHEILRTARIMDEIFSQLRWTQNVSGILAPQEAAYQKANREVE